MKSNDSRTANLTSPDVCTAKSCKLHQFSSNEVLSVRRSLLKWYDGNKRDLPWRRLTAKEEDRNRRGYAVWVSEVMLQQTQVATVVDYYKRWMNRWPTLQDLSRASLDEVNEMWAGLGYYSRARRLYEGSKKVVKDMNGEMPSSAANLVKLPGIGKYTAGAIASIAFNEPTGVVDGNVVRVLSRLRVIGLDSSSSLAVETFWKLVGKLIDRERPGDFNQAMMELGATVCTPKTPQCESCPVKEACFAYGQIESSANYIDTGLRSFFQANVSKAEETKNTKDNDSSVLSGPTCDSRKAGGDSASDIEDLMAHECPLCFPNNDSFNQDLGVCNYPRKQKMKEARQERIAVCILEYLGGGNGSGSEPLVFICKRPETGLLAGLWEFPNVVTESDLTEEATRTKVEGFLKDEFKITWNGQQKKTKLGEVQHIFSHVHHHYVVQKIVLPQKPTVLDGESVSGRSTRWVSKSEFLGSAISTAMKKVFNLYDGKTQGVKRKREGKDESTKQQVLESYFGRK